jgi:asparagine synthase (glutamine-hydrolysing)
MLHYIALIWNEADADSVARAKALLRNFMDKSPEWSITLRTQGMAVCHHTARGPNADVVYPLQNGRGVVLGRLFGREYIRAGTEASAPGTVLLDEGRSHTIAQDPAELGKLYWGQYVAFLHNSRTDALEVLRDPTGGMPCQWTRIQGVDIYFHRLEDCERLAPLDLSINKRFLVGYLALDSVCVPDTGLEQVETVLPGERISHLAGRRERTYYWNPLKFAADREMKDTRQVEQEMRDTVRACVHAWASCFRAISLELSGGFDSSVVASCLADAPTRPRVLCRNFYSAGPSSDERHYARAAARRAGFELAEVLSRSDRRLELKRRSARSPVPIDCWMDDADATDAYQEVIRDYGVEAEFTGDGGDELFYTDGILPDAVDYAWYHGLDPRLVSVALDDAVADRCSIWQVLRLARTYGWWKKPWHPRQMVRTDYRPLLRPEIKLQAQADLTRWHPLYQVVNRGTPPAKLAHAYTLTYGSTNSYIPYPGAIRPVGIAPLRSQPFIELSLRTPLYVLRAGGQDRALARRAFREDLPQEIVYRRTKACANLEVQSTVFRNINAVREILLDGFLVREGFIDRQKLERVLSGEPTQIQAGIVELCTYVTIETWVLASQRRVPQPLAA